MDDPVEQEFGSDRTKSVLLVLSPPAIRSGLQFDFAGPAGGMRVNHAFHFNARSSAEQASGAEPGHAVSLDRLDEDAGKLERVALHDIVRSEKATNA